MVCGAAFVVLHLNEWLHLINDEKVTPFGNPWNEPLFGATFFGITGLHMTHVTIGVIYLAFIAAGVGRGKYNYDHVEVSGLYWHFVDLVWMFVFAVYLMFGSNVEIHSSLTMHRSNTTRRREPPQSCSCWSDRLPATGIEVFSPTFTLATALTALMGLSVIKAPPDHRLLHD
jgi:hypothetical protein